MKAAAQQEKVSLRLDRIIQGTNVKKKKKKKRKGKKAAIEIVVGRCEQWNGKRNDETSTKIEMLVCSISVLHVPLSTSR